MTKPTIPWVQRCFAVALLMLIAGCGQNPSDPQSFEDAFYDDDTPSTEEPNLVAPELPPSPDDGSASDSSKPMGGDLDGDLDGDFGREFNDDLFGSESTDSNPDTSTEPTNDEAVEPAKDEIDAQTLREVEELVASLRSPRDWELRREIADHGAVAIRALLNMVANANAEEPYRLNAGHLVGAMHSDESPVPVEPLLVAFRNQKDVAGRRAAAVALSHGMYSEVESEELVPLFVEMVNSSNELQQQHGIWGLEITAAPTQNMPWPDEVAAAVLKFMRSANTGQAMECAEFLRHGKLSKIHLPAVKSLFEADPQAATQLLSEGALVDASLVPLLVDQLGVEDERRAETLQSAITQQGDAACDPLLDCLANARLAWESRSQAGYALLDLNSKWLPAQVQKLKSIYFHAQEVEQKETVHQLAALILLSAGEPWENYKGDLLQALTSQEFELVSQAQWMVTQRGEDEIQSIRPELCKLLSKGGSLWAVTDLLTKSGGISADMVDPTIDAILNSDTYDDQFNFHLPYHLLLDSGVKTAQRDLAVAARQAEPAAQIGLLNAIKHANKLYYGKVDYSEETKLAREWLQSDNEELRLEAAMCLAYLQPNSAEGVEILLENLLDEGIQEPTTEVANAMIQLGPLAKPALPIIDKTMERCSLGGHMCTEMLTAIGPESAGGVPRIIKILESEEFHWTFFQDYCIYLDAMGPKASAAIPALLAYMEREEDRDRVARIAVQTLVKVGATQEQILSPLRAWLKDPDKRLDAIRGMGKLGSLGPHAVGMLCQSLDHKDAAVAAAAAESLAELGGNAPGCESALIKALSHDDADVREAAAKALGKIDAEAAVVFPLLLKLASDQSEPEAVRQQAMKALGNFPEMGGSSTAAIQLLTKNLSGETGEFAAFSLGKFGPRANSAVPKLHDLVQESTGFFAYGHYSHNRPRYEAIIALGEMGHHAAESVPTLVKLFWQGHEFRRQLAEAIWKIDPVAARAAHIRQPRDN